MVEFDRKRLRERFKTAIGGEFRPAEVEVLSHAAVDYPYCRIDRLPETLIHDLDRLEEGYTVEEIRRVLTDLDTETNVFSPRDECGPDGLTNRIELGDDPEFLDRLERHVSENGTDREDGASDVTLSRVFADMRTYHDEYLDRRRDRRAETIPIASHHRATESFN